MRVEEFERYVHLGRQRDAHRLVSIAVREGKLQRKPCQLCGSPIRVDGHHRDYDKPLEVIWLCRGCHVFAARIEAMLKQCAKAVEISLRTDDLQPLAEVFAQELTNHAHRNPHSKAVYTNELRDFVEKCLRLFLLSVVSVTANSRPRRHRGRPRARAPDG